MRYIHRLLYARYTQRSCCWCLIKSGESRPSLIISHASDREHVMSTSLPRWPWTSTLTPRGGFCNTRGGAPPACHRRRRLTPLSQEFFVPHAASSGWRDPVCLPASDLRPLHASRSAAVPVFGGPRRRAFSSITAEAGQVELITFESRDVSARSSPEGQSLLLLCVYVSSNGANG